MLYQYFLKTIAVRHITNQWNCSDYFWFLFTQIIFPRITPGQAKGWPEKNVPGLLMQDFYRLDALPVTQPAVSKHWRETPKSAQTYKTSNCLWSTPAEAATVDQRWRWRDFVSPKTHKGDTERRTQQMWVLQPLSLIHIISGIKEGI